jgi:hypothetical protein
MAKVNFVLAVAAVGSVVVAAACGIFPGQLDVRSLPSRRRAFIPTQSGSVWFRFQRLRGLYICGHGCGLAGLQACSFWWRSHASWCW